MYNDDETRKSDEVYMRSLYDRFRKEVESGAIIDYYELNELLDIYDYAQDEGDAMVQMFVFLTASRLYPGNKEFDERIAFFLSYVSPDSANEMMQRQDRRESALWDVLSMGIHCYPAGDPVPYLEEILKKYDLLDCESILKIIDLMRDMEHRDLLALYYPQLKVRAEDPKGLAFEIAETIKDDPDLQEDARRIADELTKMEPFNNDAWLLLSRIEYGLGHTDDALAAVDYALAIDPNHYQSRLTRSIIMVVIPERRQEAIDNLSEFRKDDPQNPFVLEALAEAYIREKRIKDACDIYATIIKNDIVTATTNDPLVSIIELEPDNLEEYLQMYLEKVPPTEADWRSKAERFVAQEKFCLAALVLDFYHRNVGIKHCIDLYLHTLYDAGMFERFAQVFEEMTADTEMKTSNPGTFTMGDYLVLAAVYLRLGRKKEAAQLSQAIIYTKEKPDTIDVLFRSRGIRATAQFIYTLSTSKEIAIDLRLFDPLTVDFLSLPD